MRAGALGLVALAAGAQAVLRGGRTERVEAGGARQGLKAVAGDGRLARSLEGRAQEGRAQEGRSQEGRAQEGRAQASVGWKAVRGKRWSNRWSHALDEIYSDGQGQRQTMKNVMDTKYLSSFRLGGQNMTCILDTGSSDFSVFSSTCTTCGQGALYDSTKSPWYQQGQASSIERFGSGVLETTAAIDQLEIGPYRLNQSFWHVHWASMPVLRASDFQAIMGVGPPEVPRLLAWRDANRSAQLFATSLGAEGEVNQTLRDRAWSLAEKAQWLSDHPAVLEGTRERMFSICLQKEPLSPGYVVWNDTSVAQHPELFHRVPVGRPHEWSVDLRNVRFGFLEAPARDEDAAAPADAGMFQAVEQQEDEEHEAFNASAFDNVGCRDGCRALLDSGATLLSMPAGVVDKLTEEVFHKGRNCSNMWEMPHLVFELNGKSFSLPPDAYMSSVPTRMPEYVPADFRRLGEGAASATTVSLHRRGCDLLVGKMAQSNQWVFGLPFFRKYYTTFSVGDSASDRAVYLAGASKTCTPLRQRVEVHTGPPQLWKRTVDPNTLSTAPVQA